MDNESEVMAPEERIIRRQMEDTRSSLTEKLESLEQEVSDTVQGATSAVATVKETVTDTVDTVRESVQDAVTAVKNTFDLPRQVQRFPWLMMGGSVVAGFLTGRLLDRLGATDSPAASNGKHPNGTLVPESVQRVHQPAASGDKTVKGGWLGEWARPFEPELDKLKAMALSTTIGLIRDTVTEIAPEQLGPQLADVFDSITQKLGGEPIRGPVLRHFSDTETYRDIDGGRQS